MSNIAGKLIIFSVVLFLVAISASTVLAQAKVFKVDLACTLPLGTNIEKCCYEFKKIVHDKTDGRVLVTVYPAGQLYKDKDLPEVIPAGTCHMGICNADFWTGRDAALGLITGNSFLFDDLKHWYRWFDDKEVRAALDATYKRLNCKFLGSMDYGTASVIAKKKFLTLDDWKGVKIRSYGELCAKAVETLGGKPTVISSAEQYDSLMKGVIDGCMTGPPTFVVRKLYEGAKCIMKNDIGVPNFVLLMNLDLWKSMPADIQAKVAEAARLAELWGREAVVKESAEFWKQLEGPLKEKWGLEVYTVPRAEYDKYIEKVVPVHKEYLMKLSPDLSKKLFDRAEATR